MRTARSAYFVGLILCMPLFINTWGLLYNAEPPINAARTIGAAIALLWQLQVTALLLTAPWFCRACSIKQALLAQLILILAALPFIALAWLVGALGGVTVLKIFGSLWVGSLFSMSLALPFKHFRCFDVVPLNLDMPLCLIVTIFFWKTCDLWLIWLM